MAVATISVNFATLADARAGTSTITSINPRQLKDLLTSGSNMYDISIKGLTTNGNATINGTINATAGYAGNFSASGTVTGTGWAGNLAVTGNISATAGWNGSLSVSNTITATNGWSGLLSVSGEIRATNDITAFYSDKRLKDITGSISAPLDKVNSLNGIIYKNNELAKSLGFKDSDTKVGLIAQEVQSVLPEVIKIAPFDANAQGESTSGQNYLTVQYHLLVPLLVEAIKELSEKVKKLEVQLQEK